MIMVVKFTLEVGIAYMNIDKQPSLIIHDNFLSEDKFSNFRLLR